MAKKFNIKNQFQLICMDLDTPDGKKKGHTFTKGTNIVDEWIVNNRCVKKMVSKGLFMITPIKVPKAKTESSEKSFRKADKFLGTKPKTP